MLQSGFLVALSAARIMYMNFLNILSELLVRTFLNSSRNFTSEPSSCVKVHTCAMLAFSHFLCWNDLSFLLNVSNLEGPVKPFTLFEFWSEILGKKAHSYYITCSACISSEYNHASFLAPDFAEFSFPYFWRCACCAWSSVNADASQTFGFTGGCFIQNNTFKFIAQ